MMLSIMTYNDIILPCALALFGNVVLCILGASGFGRGKSLQSKYFNVS
jgi:hypothetical protein